tara:strand:- start:62 stop:1459 length:1398 start_codon:yes stop_codon:yes gene_type:complete
MKFIGQNIQDFISRFRNDIFLESISSGTIASGGHLGLDSNNKIVKASVSSSSGDIEGVTAGTGLSGGGTTGTVTLNVSGLTVSEFAGASLTTSSESFADNDTTLMTSAAINDRIESFGYGTGDITAVRLTADDSNVATVSSGSADFTIAGGSGVRTTISGTTVTAGLDVSDITSLTALTTIGEASATTNIAAGDLTMYNAVNDGNPTISLGSSATERLEIQATYETGAQGLDVVKFITHTAGSAANDARYAFQVDETFILNIKDDGIQIKASGDLEIGSGNTILSDSSGTTTLSNIDALDATTTATIQAAQVMHYEFKGFGTGDGSNFEMNVTLEDNQAPFEHATNIGSDGLTAITVQNQIRSGGQVMPRACTLKRWTGWSTCAGSATTKIRLLKLTPVRNDNSNRSMVLLHEFSYTALGNAKAESFDITSFTESAVSAGDILLTGVFAASGKTMYFTSTLEVEF